MAAEQAYAIAAMQLARWLAGDPAPPTLESTLLDVEGLGDAAAELRDAIGQAGDATLAGVPVAGRQVVQHELQAVRVQARTDLGGAVGVREQELDRLETGPGCPLEAVEEGNLREEHREVGGEARHGGNPCR